jgi:hypothetical protein
MNDSQYEKSHIEYIRTRKLADLAQSYPTNFDQKRLCKYQKVAYQIKKWVSIILGVLLIAISIALPVLSTFVLNDDNIRDILIENEKASLILNAKEYGFQKIIDFSQRNSQLDLQSIINEIANDYLISQVKLKYSAYSWHATIITTFIGIILLLIANKISNEYKMKIAITELEKQKNELLNDYIKFLTDMDDQYQKSPNSSVNPMARSSLRPSAPGGNSA